MNEETFTGYLKAFSALHKVPYEELKTLVHQYPYCQNLHHLFLEKSKLEDHEHLDKNLQRAATHTNNRSFLFKKLRQIVEKEKAEDSVVAHEEFLELPDLNALGTPLPPISKSIEAAVPTPPPLSFSNIEKQPESILDLEANFTPTDVSPDASKTNHSMQAHPEPKQEPSQSNSGSTVIEEVVPAIATTLRVLDAIIFRPQNLGHRAEKLIFPSGGKQEQPNSHSPAIGPSPKSSFPSWVQQFQPNHVKLQLSELMEAKKMEERKKAKKAKKAAKEPNLVVEQVVRRSIMENDHLASETLAELLIAQMQYQKAISVYKRLILKFPEKKAFFADKISNLKKLMV